MPRFLIVLSFILFCFLFIHFSKVILTRNSKIRKVQVIKDCYLPKDAVMITTGVNKRVIPYILKQNPNPQYIYIREDREYVTYYIPQYQYGFNLFEAPAFTAILVYH